MDETWVTDVVSTCGVHGLRPSAMLLTTMSRAVSNPTSLLR